MTITTAMAFALAHFAPDDNPSDPSYPHGPTLGTFDALVRRGLLNKHRHPPFSRCDYTLSASGVNQRGHLIAAGTIVIPHGCTRLHSPAWSSLHACGPLCYAHALNRPGTWMLFREAIAWAEDAA